MQLLRRFAAGLFEKALSFDVHEGILLFYTFLLY